MPPGPINSPGKSAILAALYPEKNNYLYFVADGTGGHLFGKTLTEHNNNVKKYQRSGYESKRQSEIVNESTQYKKY